MHALFIPSLNICRNQGFYSLSFCVELQLTSLLSETGLDIQEAHAFSTIDGYSLDVFVVGGWAVEVFSSTLLCWKYNSSFNCVSHGTGENMF